MVQGIKLFFNDSFDFVGRTAWTQYIGLELLFSGGLLAVKYLVFGTVLTMDERLFDPLGIVGHLIAGSWSFRIYILLFLLLFIPIHSLRVRRLNDAGFHALVSNLVIFSVPVLTALVNVLIIQMSDPMHFAQPLWLYELTGYLNLFARLLSLVIIFLLLLPTRTRS